MRLRLNEILSPQELMAVLGLEKAKACCLCATSWMVPLGATAGSHETAYNQDAVREFCLYDNQFVKLIIDPINKKIGIDLFGNRTD